MYMVIKNIEFVAAIIPSEVPTHYRVGPEST